MPLILVSKDDHTLLGHQKGEFIFLSRGRFRELQTGDFGTGSRYEFGHFEVCFFL
jgi:hypothetical protein